MQKSKLSSHLFYSQRYISMQVLTVLLFIIIKMLCLLSNWNKVKEVGHAGHSDFKICTPFRTKLTKMCAGSQSNGNFNFTQKVIRVQQSTNTSCS